VTEPSTTPTDSASADTEIARLLRQLHSGDESCLAKILERVMPWLRQYVHGRVRGKLKARLETQDVVQDAVANFLRDAPNFVVQGERQFHAFLRTVADNVIRGHFRYFERQRRRLSRERPLSGLSQACLDTETPSQAASRDEGEARVRLALEMMDPIEQRIICMKVYDGATFGEIGAAVGILEEAARQRYRRALPRLQQKVKHLEKGDVWGFLGRSAMP
jgi:RNA polymerase sigma factor (sigma-70 family)